MHQGKGKHLCVKEGQQVCTKMQWGMVVYITRLSTTRLVVCSLLELHFALLWTVATVRAPQATCWSLVFSHGELPCCSLCCSGPPVNQLAFSLCTVSSLFGYMYTQNPSLCVTRYQTNTSAVPWIPLKAHPFTCSSFTLLLNFHTAH